MSRHLAGGFVAALTCVSPAAAQLSEAPSSAKPRPAGNVLLIVADDFGVDALGCYGEHPNAPPTPVLDGLAADGVLFRNAYTDPTCSPSRAGMLTGRYGFRTLLGQPIAEYLPEYSLAQSEVTLAEGLQLAQMNIATSAIGKWHLGSISNGGPLHPNQQGFAWFSGTLGNMWLPAQSYWSHAKITNGVQGWSNTYATTEQVDDAIARTQAMPEPWFLYLAFNAPHQPFHAPPANLHSYHLVGDPNATPAEHYRAAVQSMDTEIGRLLASMSAPLRDRTTIIVVGDNGSPNEAVTAPFIAGQCKGTLYEGGVNVPLIVQGRGVRAPGRQCDKLVNAVDLYPTMLELLGTSVSAVDSGRMIDGVSFVPLLRDPAADPVREWVFAEKFIPNGPGPYANAAQMIRDERWKLVRRAGNQELFFDLEGLSFERDNLLAGPLDHAQFAAYRRLSLWLDRLLRS